jgi:endonuclease/exonuclease/phosphatase family metal-dependent hydrolase
MKYLLLFAIIISSFLTNGNVHAKDEQSYKLLVLNTWMIPFLRKMPKTRSVLIGKNSQDYDFVMFQEVFGRRQRKLITRHINRGEDRFYNRYQTTPFAKINSGLFNHSKFRIISSSFKRFSRCGGAQCWSGKGLLHTRVRLADGSEMDIYNTHLQPFGSETKLREHQMGEILEHIERTNGADRPAILTGDFNISGGGSEYVTVNERLNLNGFFDAWTTLNQNDPGYTWDSNINTWSQKTDNGYTSQHRFDYIYVRDGKNKKFDLLKSEVVFDEPKSITPTSKKYFLADHFGVDLTFKLYSDD